MTGVLFDRVVLGLVGLAFLLILFAVLRRSPRLALLGWLGSICLVPVWQGVSVGGPYLPAFAVMGLLGTLSLLPLPRLTRPAGADVLFFAVAVIVFWEAVLGLTTHSGAYDVLAVWSSAYLFGRFVVLVVEPSWLYGALGLAGAGVGVLAVLEYATGYNIFVQYLANGSSLFGLWGQLQPRGDAVRAEGAFGHSIAMGISLGVFACLALSSRFRPSLKVLLTALCAIGSLVSLSRSGILTTVLGVLLSCFFLRGHLARPLRLLLLALLALGAAAAAGFLSGTFASSDEAEGSALYRGALLELVGTMRPIGLTAVYNVSTTHEVSVGSFGSIDNAVLLFGLMYGWVPLLLALLAATGALITVLRRRATPATVAAVAQIPALFTVALITQYAGVAWFCFGLAVGTQVLQDDNSVLTTRPRTFLASLPTDPRTNIGSTHA